MYFDRRDKNTNACKRFHKAAVILTQNEIQQDHQALGVRDK